jgi:hypothetical protein
MMERTQVQQMKGFGCWVGVALAVAGCCECPKCDLGDVVWAEVEVVRIVRKTYCDDADITCESEMVDETTYDLTDKTITQVTADSGTMRSGDVPSGSQRSKFESDVSDDLLLRRIACAYSCEIGSHAPDTADTLFITMKNREISMRISGCDKQEEPEIAAVRETMLKAFPGFFDS